MKTFISILLLAIFPAVLSAAGQPPKLEKCGKWKGHQLYRGEQGGCFYLKTKAKKKVYVDKKYCNC